MTKLFIIILLILCLPAVIGIPIRRITYIQQSNITHTKTITSEHAFDYRLTAPADNLSSVIIKLQNLGTVNRDPFIFTLSDETQTLRRIAVNGSNIGNDDNVRFAFDPIAHSSQKQFKLRLESITSDSNSAIKIPVDDTNQPHIATYHTVTGYQQIVQHIYREWYQKLYQDLVFSGIYASMISVILIGIIQPELFRFRTLKSKLIPSKDNHSNKKSPN